MSEKNEIKCDNPECGADITYTGNSVSYRTKALWYTKDRGSGGAVTDLMVYPPIKNGLKHFCDTSCLRAWAVKNIPESRKGVPSGHATKAAATRQARAINRRRP